MKQLEGFSREQLIEILTDASKNWLAHDGVWFQAVERAHGLEEAIRLDTEAWERFTVIEAQRIMKRVGIAPGGGIPALIRALGFRLYAFINDQAVVDVTDRSCVFMMKTCRVQEARKRQGLPDFPCKPVGLVEYAGFAKTIDPRIRTECVACPPDAHPPEYHCAWRFTLDDGVDARKKLRDR
ncbi:MAG: DUF6125 family protein [Planctomycetota bacterium]|nr:DUF6125 family protein [Planctomycetota bacterium]